MSRLKILYATFEERGRQEYRRYELREEGKSGEYGIPPQVVTWLRNQGITDIEDHWNTQANKDGWKLTHSLRMVRISKEEYEKNVVENNNQSVLFLKKDDENEDI